MNPRLEVNAPAPVHAGVDGEAVDLRPPLRFAIWPAALRVRICPAPSGCLAVSASPPPGLPTRVMAHFLGTVVACEALHALRPARLSPGYSRVTAGSARRRQGAFLKRAGAHGRAVAPFS